MAAEAESTIPERPATHGRKAQLWLFIALGVVIVLLFVDALKGFLSEPETPKVREQVQPTVPLDNRDFSARVESARSTSKVQEDEAERRRKEDELRAALEAEKARLQQQEQEALAALKQQLVPRQIAVAQSKTREETWAEEERLRALGSYSSSGLEFELYDDGKPKAAQSSGNPYDPDNIKGTLASLRDGGAQGGGLFGGAGQGAEKPTIQAFEDAQDEPAKSTGELLPPGTVIHAVMNQKVMSDYMGHYTALVTRPVYDITRRYVLIPEGSKVIGEVKPVRNVNQIIQNRVAFTNRWVVRPDGSKVSFAKTADTTDREGVAAVADDVDYHWGWRAFGVISYALLASNSSYEGTGANSDISYSTEVSEGARDAMRPAARQYVNLVPTVIINQGEPIKLMLYDELRVDAWSHI